MEPDGEKNNVNEDLNTEKKPPVSMIHLGSVKGTEKKSATSFWFKQRLCYPLIPRILDLLKRVYGCSDR